MPVALACTRIVLCGGLLHAFPGVAVETVDALALVRFLESGLVSDETTDVLTIPAVGGLLSLVPLLAS